MSIVNQNFTIRYNFDSMKPQSMWNADLGDRYSNPVLYADYSDPDAIRLFHDCVELLQFTGTANPSFKGYGELESY